MKAGPVFAMVGLLAVGVWLVLQPSLEQGRRIDPDAHRFEVVLGAEGVRVEQRAVDGGGFEYHFVGGEREMLGWVGEAVFQAEVAKAMRSWEARPAFERTLLGFFNITGWVNFVWVGVGLLGQAAFFGRMMIQWVVSEKQRQSVVPELFWWLSFLGGLSLFTYFVWRTDIVGVLGQSTGVVVYARNLRLIRKQRRRERRDAMRAEQEAAVAGATGGEAEPSDDDTGARPEGAVHAGVSG